MKRLIKNTIGLLIFKAFICLHRLLHSARILPYSKKFGRERGTPVSRYYVEKFLQENSHYVGGRCLAFGTSRYREYFPNVTHFKITDIINRPGVDYVCDIHDPDRIPRNSFDAVICTQVFEHIAYPEVAARSIFNIMAPGGVLLLTAPFISPVHYVPTDFRRFTPECLEMILNDAGFKVQQVDFGGNSMVGTGTLFGMVREDFTIKELDRKDSVYPVIIMIMARKPCDRLDK